MLVPCEQATCRGEHDWLTIRLCTGAPHSGWLPDTIILVQQLRWILHPDLIGFLPLSLSLTLSALLATTKLQRKYSVSGGRSRGTHVKIDTKESLAM